MGLTVACIGSMFSLTASAATDTKYKTFKNTYGTWVYTVANNEATITAYRGTAANVVVPAKINGYPVTKISDAPLNINDNNRAFENNSDLKSVTIPSSVKVIGELDSLFDIITNAGPFFGCENLTKVTLNEGLESIGALAFASTGLTSVKIPNSVTHLGEQAFGACKNLTRVTIGTGIKTLVDTDKGAGQTPFSGSKIETLEVPEEFNDSNIGLIVPDGEIQGGQYVTDNGVLFTKDKKTLVRYPSSSSKASSYTIPVGVQNIGERAFEDSNLLVIRIPATVKCIEAAAFYGCNKLIHIYVNDNNQNFVREGNALYDIQKTRLIHSFGLSETLVIPSSVQNVDQGALYNPSLTTVTITSNITSGQLDLSELGFCYRRTPAELTIKGYTNSVVESYCKKKGFNFAALDAKTTTTIETTKTTETANSSSTVSQSQLRGDTNNDGKLAADDVRRIMLLIASGEGATKAHDVGYDTNGDGKVSISDGRCVMVHAQYFN